MLVTIAFVVIFASIIVLFSDELRAALVMVVSNKWLQLLVPQFLLAFLIIKYDNEISLFLISRQIKIISNIYLAYKDIAFLHIDISIVQILYLILVAVLPLLIAKILKKTSFIKIDCSKVCFWISVFLWAFVAILLTNIISGN